MAKNIIELKNERKALMIGEGVMAGMFFLSKHALLFIIFIALLIVTYKLYQKKIDEIKYMKADQDDDNLEKLHKLENEIYDLKQATKKKKK